MPSHAETFGLVILEALSCGLPVIAREIPEFREIFSDAVLFFSDAEQAGAMIADDAALNYCARGARVYTEQFDIRKVAQMHIDLYRELAGA
jgi:glycosyltransferase involved in cell wall biosynthesis